MLSVSSPCAWFRVLGLGEKRRLANALLGTSHIASGREPKRFVVYPLSLSLLCTLSPIAPFVTIHHVALQLSCEVSRKRLTSSRASSHRRLTLCTLSGHKSMPQSRKRVAPSAMTANRVSQQSIQYPYQPTAPMGTQAVDWNYAGNNNGIVDHPNGSAGYTFSPYSQQQLIPSETSTQLARRPTSNRTQTDLGGGTFENWPTIPGQGVAAPQRHETWVEDLGELKEKAAAVKRESKQGRKDIPPFLRKIRRSRLSPPITKQC